MRRVRVLDLEERVVATDAQLSEQAGSGNTAAFEELYRRHSPAAWRVAQSVTGNRHDAADAVADAFTRVFQALPTGRLREGTAFRPYLLSATRNAALDQLRRSGRVTPTDSDDLGEGLTLPDTPSDKVLDSLDRSMVTTAFLSLPERWRSVLWLTEVEGISSKEAGLVMGLSANGVAQLAVRARAGLRERYLQAHISDHMADGCRLTASHLGAYVAGGLAPRDIAKVDQHLAGCKPCTEKLAELEDLGGGLRRAVVPVPIALGAIAASRFKAAMNVAVGTGRSKAWIGDPTTIERVRHPLMMSALGLAALGIIGVGVVRPSADPETRLASPRLIRPGLNPPVAFLPATETTLADDQGGAAAPAFAGEVDAGRGDGSLPLGPAVAPSGSRPPGPTSTTPPPKPPPPPAPAPPVAQLTARIDVAGPIAVSVGDGCLGANLAGTVVGCSPPASPKPGSPASISTGGSLLGSNNVAP